MADSTASSHALSAPAQPDAAPRGAVAYARELVSLTKPRLSSLVLVTAGGGLWLSGAQVPLSQAVAAVLGTTLVVGGANALNCYIERDSDKLMARTSTRALPQGRVSAGDALAFGMALSLVSVPLLTLATTPLAGLLAASALLLYVVVYTPLKRSSSLSTLIGAIPGAMPPLIGWTAATGTLDMGGIALFALMFIWQIPHSLAIGIYRQSEYERAGLVVFPTEHGLHATRRQILLHTLALAPLPLLLVHLDVGGPLTLSIGLALGLVFLYRAWQGFSQQLGAKWARQLFLFSLIYLCSVFAALAVDQWI